MSDTVTKAAVNGARSGPTQAQPSLVCKVRHAESGSTASPRGIINTRLSLFVINDPVQSRVFLDRTPMDRFAEAEEMAKPILYLCSDGASFHTGDFMIVDGGYSVGCRSPACSTSRSFRAESASPAQPQEAKPMATAPGPKVSLAEFDRMFESVKNWGKWGPDDQLGTLNYITRDKVRQAAGLVKSGRQVSMEIPINKAAGPDNPNQAFHYVTQSHDIDIKSNGLTFALDFLGMACHGDCHTHIDALCHIAYKGQTYNGKSALEVMTSKGATTLDITSYGNGLVGRGVLLDIPRLRGVKWLEPGEAVKREELEACEKSIGLTLGEGDILVFRTGHHRRRLELGAWSNDPPPDGGGKAGLHVDTIPWMHERRLAAFLPDGDGEAVPSTVEGMTYPIHPLQIAAMGMLASDSLQFEDLARACEDEGRWEFMVVGLPLRLPGGTGSPWNPIAIF